MELQIVTPQSHSIRLIAVASEKMNVNIYDIEVLVDNKGRKYEVLDHFTHRKSKIFPSGLMLLSVGQDVEEKDVWKAYNKSDIIYFFIVKTL